MAVALVHGCSCHLGEHADQSTEPDFRYLDSRIAQDARAAPADLESSSAENGRRSSLLLDF